jgi:uncharacterized surface protein with fasciclin (FAS1) repeats
MFAVLFGLSMDYEVFLLSAVHDDWLDTGDAHGSVVRGLARTGRVISAAAAIMAAVFLGFAALGAAIAANPLLRSLTTALRKADLLDTLDQQRDLTVFAPDDQAFQAFAQNQGADHFYALLADQNVLGDLLKYHVVGHRYDRVGLVGQGTVGTLEGASLRVRDAGDVVEVTDNTGTTARVVCGNIPTANATLFLVDQVLQPKRP